MTVIAFSLNAGNQPGTAKKFVSSEAAKADKSQPFWFIPENVAQLASDTLLAPSSAMLRLFNQLAPTPVGRFADRKTAAKRLWDICEKVLPEPEPFSPPAPTTSEPEPNTSAPPTEQKEENEMATATATKKAAAKNSATKAPAKAAAKKAPAKNTTGLRGRVSAYAGKVLRTTTETNPRRAGTAGFKSMEVLIKAGKAGITFEDFTKKGGRSNDLAWDIDKGNATAKDK